VFYAGELGKDVADAALDVLIRELGIGAVVGDLVGRELLREREVEVIGRLGADFVGRRGGFGGLGGRGGRRRWGAEICWEPWCSS
jgi:hypothetical protein